MANLTGCQRCSTMWFGIGSCFLLLVFGSYAAERCGETVYDINNLRIPSNWTFELAPTEDTGCLGNLTQVKDCAFFISFCRPMKCLEHDANACLVEGNGSMTTATYMLAEYNKSQDPFKDRNGGDGFYVEFPKGGLYNNSNGKVCNLMLNLTFTCNVSYPWIPPHDSRQAVVDKGAIKSLQYDNKTCKTYQVVCQRLQHDLLWNRTVNLRGGAGSNDENDLVNEFLNKEFKYDIECYYAGACPQIVPLPSETINQLSTGSILLIIFFVVLVLYFTLGMTINCVQGRKGKELLPHNELWLNLPVYITDGFVFTFSCGRAQNAGKSYESI